MLHMDQRLEIGLRESMMARRRAIENKKVRQELDIPKRQPTSPATVTTPTPKPVARIEQEITRKPPASEIRAQQTWDIFMSHASPDKRWVRGLVTALREADVTVWFDEDCLEWGEDLQRGINQGLKNCRKVIAVLSKPYLAERKWTEAEISGLLAREKLGETLILPIWHQITEYDFQKYNLILASRIGKVSDSDNYDEIVRAVLKVLGRQPDAGKNAGSSAVVPKEGTTVASVFYYSPDGQRPHMTVKNAADREGWFILRHTDGSVDEGTLSDIAITEFEVADKSEAHTSLFLRPRK